MNIIFEDKHVIVAQKPPKVPSQSDLTEDVDMLSMLKEHLKNEYPSAKDPYIGLIHRLDRPVGGVMVFAKTKESNANLSEQVRTKKFQKYYYVIVCGKPESEKGELRNYLKKVTSSNMSKVVTKESKAGKEAILEYELIDSINTEEYGMLSLLRVDLKTGRHHQIRIQLSHAKLPIWGDNKYNKTFVQMKKWTQIALCAYSLSFYHPKDKKFMTFESNQTNEYPFSLFSQDNII